MNKVHLLLPWKLKRSVQLNVTSQKVPGPHGCEMGALRKASTSKSDAHLFAIVSQ